MHKKVIIISLLLIPALISACSPAPAPEPTDTPVPTEAPTPTPEPTATEERVESGFYTNAGGA